MVNAVGCGLGHGLGSRIETKHGRKSFRDVEKLDCRGVNGSEEAK